MTTRLAAYGTSRGAVPSAAGRTPVVVVVSERGYSSLRWQRAMHPFTTLAALLWRLVA